MILAVLMLLGNPPDRPGITPRAFPEVSLEGVFLGVRIPSQILLNPEVRRILQSGLTTSFVLDVAVLGIRGNGGHARLDLRYEPWDEIYMVSLAQADGQTVKEKLASFALLVDWWEKLRFKVLPVRALEGLDRPDLKMTLSVMPFSATEEGDARRWFARSIDDSRGTSSPPIGNSPGEARKGPDHLLDALITTSIKRRVLQTFQWTVSIPKEVRR